MKNFGREIVYEVREHRTFTCIYCSDAVIFIVAGIILSYEINNFDVQSQALINSFA